MKELIDFLFGKKEKKEANPLIHNIKCNSCGFVQISKGLAMDTLGYRGKCQCGAYLYEHSYQEN